MAARMKAQRLTMENQYTHKDLDIDKLKDSNHRAFVGGMWDEIGQLQFDYMVSKGLSPSDRFIDVACGSMRGGRFFIRHLEAQHYYGFDLVRDLIDAGLKHEIEPLGLLGKVNFDNLVAAEGFAFPPQWRGIDSGIALSLFTHLTLNSIALCLSNLGAVMKDKAKFYATIFHVTESQQMTPQDHLDGITTFLCQDPYHYTRADMDYLAAKTGWRVEAIEEFGHPRGQSMVVFQKL